MSESVGSPQFPSGSVALIGAGPGAADLMTVRARDLLAQAQVVLYDALLDPEITGLIPPGAERLNAGKRKGAHQLTQETINQTLVEKARQGLRVVRLKGGDPFVYGRGSEEYQALLRAGVAVQVVPGVSAMNGVTALAGIPLTHRGVSDRVLVLSGHDLGAPNWAQGVSPDFSGTLVVYMAASRTADVARHLLGVGLPGSLPCALIEDGASPQSLIGRSHLSDCAEGSLGRSSAGPGLFVCGPTVLGLGNLPGPEQAGAGEKEIPKAERGEFHGDARGHFPIWLDLNGKNVLVVGAGRVALQKISTLLAAGAVVTAVAPFVCPPVVALAQSGKNLRLIRRRVNVFDFWGKRLVIAATNNPATNLMVAQKARRRGLWVNSVDDPPACDFYTGATLERGFVNLAISTGGRLPGLSGLLRKLLGDLLPPEGDGAWANLAELRARLKTVLPASEDRMEALRKSIRSLEKEYFQLTPPPATNPSPPNLSL